MPTVYPAQIDTPQTLPVVVDNITPINSAIINGLRQAIINIEQTLGVNPARPYATVADRITSIENALINIHGVQIGQDLGGTPTAPLVIGIQGRPISSTQPDTGQVLTWDGVAWAPIFPDITEGFLVTLGGPPIFAEFGQSVINPIFVATYSLTPETGIIRDNIGGPAQNIFVQPGLPFDPDSPFAPPQLFTYNASYEYSPRNPITPSSITFSLFSTTNGGLITNTTTFTTTWTQRIYYGTALPGGNTGTFIQTLANNPLTTSEGFNFTINAGAGQAIYFAYRTAYGLATFWVDGFEGGFNLVGTIPLTNSYGFTENYYLYQTTQVDLGITEISVLYPSTTTLASLDFYNPSNGIGNLLGDVIGSTNSNTVTKIQGTSVSLTAPNGQEALVYNGATYVPTGIITVANIISYGAIGNGTSNDTAAVQAAFNSGNHYVYLPSGTYLVDTIIVPTNVTIIQGPGTLKQRTFSNGILTITNSNGLIIRDVNFQGIAGTTASSNNTAIDIISSSNVKVHNCTFNNMLYFSIHFTGSSYCEALNNTILNGANGIRCTVSDHILIDGNYLGPPQVISFVIGIGLDSTNQPYIPAFPPGGICTDIIMSHNRIEGWHNSQGLFGHAGVRIVVSDNIVTDVDVPISFNPFQLGDTMSDLLITNNVISGTISSPGTNVQPGITVQGDSTFPVVNVTVSGNKIDTSNAFSQVFGSGGMLFGYVNRLNIFDNTIRDGYGCGIALGNPCPSLNITGNSIFNILPTGGGPSVGIYGISGVQNGNIQNNRIESVNWGMRFDVSSPGLIVGKNTFHNITTAVIINSNNVTLQQQLANTQYLSSWDNTLAESAYRLIGLDSSNNIIINPDNQPAFIDGSNITINGTSNISLQNNGATKISINSTGIGFFNATPIAKPSITGGSGTDTAFDSLLTQLVNLGLITNSTTSFIGTYIAGTTTPSVTDVSFMYITNASPTTITNFTGAVNGQKLMLVFADDNTTITRANAYLNGKINFISTQYAVLSLVYSTIDNNWHEVSRSVANDKLGVTSVVHSQSPYTTLITDKIIGADSTLGVITINLPASPQTGDSYQIKDITGQAGTNNITISGNGNNIDGTPTLVISSNYGFASLTFTGTRWSTL